MPDSDAIDPSLAERALAEATTTYPKFASMKPYLEMVKLFRGSQIVVKFKDDKREKGDPDNFSFEKAVVRAYRALLG
jgi:hypothetical protein